MIKTLLVLSIISCCIDASNIYQSSIPTPRYGIKLELNDNEQKKWQELCKKKKEEEKPKHEMNIKKPYIPKLKLPGIEAVFNLVTYSGSNTETLNTQSSQGQFEVNIPETLKDAIQNNVQNPEDNQNTHVYEQHIDYVAEINTFLESVKIVNSNKQIVIDLKKQYVDLLKTSNLTMQLTAYSTNINNNFIDIFEREILSDQLLIEQNNVIYSDFYSKLLDLEMPSVDFYQTTTFENNYQTMLSIKDIINQQNDIILDEYKKLKLYIEALQKVSNN